MRKETVDIGILVTTRNGNRKIMQSIRTMCRPPMKIRKWNQVSQFRWTYTKVIPIEETKFQQWAKGLREGASERPGVKTERTEKITTQWWPNIILKKPKQTIHYIYFLLSYYCIHIMLLVWSKNWNWV